MVRYISPPCERGEGREAAGDSVEGDQWSPAFPSSVTGFARATFPRGEGFWTGERIAALLRSSQ